MMTNIAELGQAILFVAVVVLFSLKVVWIKRVGPFVKQR